MMPCRCAASSASAICLRDGQRFVDRQAARLELLGQRQALDELKYQRQPGRRLAGQRLRP